MIIRRVCLRSQLWVVCSLIILAGPVGAVEIQENRSAEAISWKTEFVWGQASLAVAGPPGIRSWLIPAGAPLTLDIEVLAAWAEATGAAVDGDYRFEIVFSPHLDDDDRQAMTRIRAGEGRTLPLSGPISRLPKISGTFRISGGAVVGAGTPVSEGATSQKDVLHYDDVIVTGSLCTGFDCANGESFGYCTSKLKENNLQLCFEDTSSGSFPSRDWKIQINDTNSGGANYFTIWDVDSGRRPFTIEGGAPAHSLFVEDYGRVGLGTSIPYVELHIADGDSPTIRLDQDGSSGWTAQRWDMAGNESNFFIRDVTNGSKLSFRIEPNTPSSTLSLRSSGNVGLGTWSPAAKLEIETTGEPANLLLDRTDGGQWYFTSMADDTLTISTTGTEGDELVILDGMGNLTTSGTVNGVSDRDAKTGFAPVDASEVLEKIVTLSLTEWSLARDPSGIRHLGPTAQDFHARFGLGGDDRHISLSDMSGVAFAAIQALAEELEQRDAEISDLERRLAALEKRVATSD